MGKEDPFGFILKIADTVLVMINKNMLPGRLSFLLKEKKKEGYDKIGEVSPVKNAQPCWFPPEGSAGLHGQLCGSQGT